MDNKKVLITGGGKRIGAALAAAFAGADFQVFIHVNESYDAACALLKTLKNPELHRIVRCDLSDPQLRKKWLDELPGFDLVINNASCYRLNPPEETETPEIRQKYWQVNYHAPLEIIEQQKAHAALAINLLDCEVLLPGNGIKEFIEPAEGCDSYLATRVALAHKLQELARELAPAVRICSIAPGPVLPPVNCRTAGMTKILGRVPMKQSVGVQEIVNTALFLWNNPSLTGAIIPVDGGMHL